MKPMSTLCKLKTLLRLPIAPVAAAQWGKAVPFSSKAHVVIDDILAKHSPPYQCSSNERPHLQKKEMPPDLPSPKYSVLRRMLPGNLVALSSSQGRTRLMEAMSSGSAESYWSLSEHFVNQSDPAFCGVTTLVTVLNSLSVDPHVRWRGGWRYFGDETVLLGRCCYDIERIRRIGIDMIDFERLARCQGLKVKRREPTSLTDFRSDIRQLFQPTASKSTVMVVSFCRQALQQTGSGHFSPVAAYHELTDSILILDVARFKYPPYWASVEDVYNAMVPIDESTNKSRGWFLLDPPQISASYYGTSAKNEHRRPARTVPEIGEPDICPIGTVKVDYCQASRKHSP